MIMIKRNLSKLFKTIKKRMYNSYYNATITQILWSLIFCSYIIIDDIFIPQSTENVMRKIILIVVLLMANLLRLILSIKSGAIFFRRPKKRGRLEEKTQGDG